MVDADGTIRAACGIGQPWDKGDGGPAISAGVVMVMSVRYGPDDALYLGDAVGRVRRIDPHTGIITTVAGIGLPGYSGDGGKATAARHRNAGRRSRSAPTAACTSPTASITSSAAWPRTGSSTP